MWLAEIVDFAACAIRPKLSTGSRTDPNRGETFKLRRIQAPSERSSDETVLRGDRTDTDPVRSGSASRRSSGGGTTQSDLRRAHLFPGRHGPTHHRVGRIHQLGFAAG